MVKEYVLIMYGIVPLDGMTASNV